MFQKIITVLVFLLLAYLAISHRTPTRETKEISSKLFALKKDVSELQKTMGELAQLESELRIIKSSLRKTTSTESPLGPIEVLLNGSHINDPFLGQKDAPIIMMAFSNYQCKPCRQFTLLNLESLQKDYINTGKVKYIYRDLPLKTNPQAFSAASLAHCAGEQGQYWQIHDKLYKNPTQVDEGKILSLVKDLNQLNFQKIEECFFSRKYDSEIQRDFEEAREFGAKGAPYFVILRNTGDSSLLKGVFIRGAQPYGVFKRQIEQLLSD